MRLVQKLLPFVLLILLAGTLVAQSPTVAIAGANDGAVQADRIAQLQQQIADAKDSADNAWMLVSSALVLMMTGPGLALFYGGLVRKKNVLCHHDAELRHDGDHHRAVGNRRLQPLLCLRR